MDKKELEVSMAEIESQLLFIHSQMQENLEKIAEFRTELKNFMEGDANDE